MHPAVIQAVLPHGSEKLGARNSRTLLIHKISKKLLGFCQFEADRPVLHIDIECPERLNVDMRIGRLARPCACVTNFGGQFFLRHRFEQIPCRMDRIGVKGIFLVRGQKQNRSLRRDLLDPGCQRDAVDLWHINIQDCKIHRVSAKIVQCKKRIREAFCLLNFGQACTLP